MIKCIAFTMILGVLAACSSDDGEPTLSFGLLPPDRVSLALDGAELDVRVFIDGQSFSVDRGVNGRPWVGNFVLPTDRPLSLSVEWFYRSLLIARYEQTIDPITDSASLEVSAQQYVTTGIEFDADCDGASNLAELNVDTNPGSAENIDFVIPKLGPSDVIAINGGTGDTWARFITNTWKGDLPRIDNLMIDRNALRADGEAEFYWQAVHDGTNLFVIVYGEAADIASPIRDSRVATRDDAVRLFFDGDNSKLDSYDGINDLFITIPLAAQRVPADSSIDLVPVVAEDGDYIFNAQRFIAVGDASTPTFVEAAPIQPNASALENTEWIIGPQGQAPAVNFDGFEFENGFQSQGTQVYEIKIPLVSLGIEIDQPFGFEVQIDSEHNGGDSDARYGWRHPSKDSDGPDVNFTEQEPSLMGTAVLAE